jgi:hypothetical protein
VAIQRLTSYQQVKPIGFIALALLDLEHSPRRQSVNHSPYWLWQAEAEVVQVKLRVEEAPAVSSTTTHSHLHQLGTIQLLLAAVVELMRTEQTRLLVEV